MKPLTLPVGFLALTAAVLPLVNGCVAQSSEAQESAANPPVLITQTDVVNLAEAPASPAGPANVEAVPATGEKKLPPNLILTAPAASADILKLAQAGVEESVLLAYITNSTKTFALSSDEIIYLNDLGVSPNVITAIMEHDNTMKRIWANAALAPTVSAAPAPTIDETATAPSYVEAPVATPAPTTTVVNNNYFYDSLSPYGNWIEVDGYGRCWQPTVVVGNRGWQPYADRGRWVWSDAGWYWLSDYSWGATTFHYGRWFNHARWGWCWWPDTIWAPSWVTWRYSSDYCGWAPLPPHSYYSSGVGFSYYGSLVGISFGFGLSSSCYTFVPTARFCDPHPYRHRVHYSKAVNIYNNTTVINNYGSGNNNQVNNRGIDPDQIRRVSKTEIKQVALRDAPPAAGRPSRGEQLERDGRTLVVNRPQFNGNRDGLGHRDGRPGGRDGGRESGPSGNLVNSKVTPVKPSSPAPSVSRPVNVADEKPRGGFRTDNPITTPLVTTPKPEPRVVTAPKVTEPKPTPTPSVPQTGNNNPPNNPPVVSGRDQGLPNNRWPANQPQNKDKERGSSIFGNSRGSASPVPPPVATQVTPAPTPTTPAAPVGSAPPKPSTPSLVVIGRNDGKPTPNKGDFKVFPPQGTPSGDNFPATGGRQVGQGDRATPQPRQPIVVPSAPSQGSQNSSRSESPRIRIESPRVSQPTPSAPVPAAPRSVSPSFSSPPSRPAAPAPSVNQSPSYSAPRPSYTPPAAAPTPAPRSQPAPAAPSVSAPRAPVAAPPASSSSSSQSQSKSDNGNGNGGGRGRGRN